MGRATTAAYAVLPVLPSGLQKDSGLAGPQSQAVSTAEILFDPHVRHSLGSQSYDLASRIFLWEENLEIAEQLEPPT